MIARLFFQNTKKIISYVLKPLIKKNNEKIVNRIEGEIDRRSQPGGGNNTRRRQSSLADHEWKKKSTEGQLSVGSIPAAGGGLGEGPGRGGEEGPEGPLGEAVEGDDQRQRPHRLPLRTGGGLGGVRGRAFLNDGGGGGPDPGGQEGPTNPRGCRLAPLTPRQGGGHRTNERPGWQGRGRQPLPVSTNDSDQKLS